MSRNAISAMALGAVAAVALVGEARALSCVAPQTSAEEAAREMPYIFEAVATSRMDRQTGFQRFRVVEVHKGDLPERVVVKIGGAEWGARHQKGELTAFAVKTRDGHLYDPACPQYENWDTQAVIEALSD